MFRGAKVRAIVPRLINVRDLVPEISVRTYATHGIDKYPAKMVPQMAHYAISAISRRGELVFDPFCGCGTVLVEATLLGRHSVGIDVNPVAVLLARSKAAIFDVWKFDDLAHSVVDDANCAGEVTAFEEPAWLPYWFTPRTLNKLRQLRHQIWRGLALSPPIDACS